MRTRATEAPLPTMAMDNFNVDVTARTSDVLRHVILLACASFASAESYSEVDREGKKTLILHWMYKKEDPTQVKFAYPFKIDQILPFVEGWLANQDYGKEPDIDGSCTKGWHLFTDTGGWTNYLFCLQPEWAIHHK